MSGGKSRIVIDLAQYRQNLEAVRKLTGEQARLAAVVKHNAYGHGFLPMARTAATLSSMLGVATVDEALALRQAQIETPILVLDSLPHARLGAAIEHRLTVVLSDVGTAEALGELAHRVNRVVRVHCLVNTGGGFGFAPDSAVEDIQYITRISHIDIEGICTTLGSGSRSDETLVANQLKVFRQVLKQLDKQGIPYEMAHAADSTALVYNHGVGFDLVRVGLLTYGVVPPDALALSAGVVKPVLRWEVPVSEVRDLEPGSRPERWSGGLPGRMRAATLLVGTGDGYPQALAERADVLLHGRRCRVRGRVQPDELMVDVSEVEQVAPGDIATLIGTDGGQTITAQELAGHAGINVRNFLSGLSDAIEREHR
jgi:alanine racemase